MIPQVNAEEAKKFSSVWNYNGIAIALDDVHLKFATDFANVVLRSFVVKITEDIQKQMAAQQTEPKPLVTVT